MKAIGKNIICTSLEIEEKVGSLILPSKSKPKYWLVMSKGDEVKEIKIDDKIYVNGGSVFDHEGKDYLLVTESQVVAVV